MRKEEWRNRNILSLIGRQAKRRRRFFPIKAFIMISFILTLVPLISFAGPLDNFVVGRGGEWQCFPPEDGTPCRETTDYPRFRLVSEKIFGKCTKWAVDPKTHEKYLTALSGLVIPGVGPKFVVAYFLSEGIDDLGQCILGGMLEYAGYSEKAVDAILKTTFALKDDFGLGQKIKQFDPEDRLKVFELPFEGRDRVQDFNEITQDEGILSLSEIKTFTQLYNEYFKGVTGKIRNQLEEADQKMAVCQFNEAEKMIKSAEALTRNYCEESGRRYRWLEKNIRCLQEKHRKWLEKVFQSNRPPLEALPIEERRRLEREMQTIGPQTIKAREEVIEEQKKLLATWEKDTLQDLKIFDEMKNRRKLLEEKKADFERRKKEYDEEKDKAILALQGGDLKNVCEILIRIKDLEKDLQKLPPECVQRICGYRDGRLWGDFLEEALQKNASGLKEDVKILLKEAKEAMKRPCKMDVAREKLSECDRMVEKLRIYSGGRCVNDFDLEREIREAWTQFNTIDQNDKAIRALLGKAEKLATNTCTFDQALSGETTEENIKRNLKNSCVEEEEVNNRLSRIKRLMEMFKKKAEAEEKAIFSRIAGLHELINPTIPKCDVEGALKALGEAEDRFKEHLMCENTDPRPSNEVRERADRVRTGIETARQFISSRSSEINQARRQYRQMVSSLLAKTKDPCHYKEAISQPLKESLTGWARDFCRPEEANKDIQTIEEAIRKWDERIQKDMEALRQGIAKVEREQNCQVAEELLKKQKENLSYLKDCKEYKEPIKKAFDTMESAIAEKKKGADQKVQQAVNGGQNALAKCLNLEQALNQMKQIKSALHDTCISSNLLEKRNSVAEQLEQQIWDIQDRKKGIYVLLSEAEKTLKTCEWSALEEQLSEAKQTLPGEPCFSSQPAFSDLKRRILDLESRKETKKKTVEWYQARHLIIIRNAKAYLDAKNRGQKWGAELQKAYNDNIADLQKFIQGAESEKLGDCLYDLIGQARDMLAQMGAPPRDSIDQVSTPCANRPGSVPILDRNNRITCICPSEKGLAWNRDKTACIDYRQAAIESVDCSRWPGSIPLWNNQTNRAECFCPQGMVWNQNRTACISARQQPPPRTDPTPTGPPRQVKCNDTAKQGGNTPETLVVDLGRTSGVFRFDYDMYDVPDRMIVHYGGGTYDTQCTGGKQGHGRDKGSVNLQFFGSSQVTIKVLPACQGGSTSWKFTVHCPR